MRILFLQTNTYRLLWPQPIGPALVARRLQDDGHQVEFVDLMGEADPVATARDAAARFAPDLACFTIRNRDNQSAAHYDDPLPGIRAVIAAVRAASPAPHLLGGTAFTTYPARLLTLMGAEYGLAGDDLAQVSRFVASLAAGQPDLATPGLVYRHDQQVVENPFTLVGYRGQHIDYQRLVDPRRYRRAYWQAAVVTRTGCPERCAYCDTYRTFGREFILREPVDVAEELLAFKRGGRVRAAFLVDSGFNRPLDHAKAVLEAIIRAGAQLQLYGIYDPGEGDDEFFRLYARAGGMMFTVFAESLADAVLAELAKPFGVAEVVRDAQGLRRAGIGMMFMPTFGGPGETRDTVAETLRRVPELAPSLCDFGIGWRIQPGTPLRDRAVAEGLLDDDDDCFEATFYISPATPREWIAEQICVFRRRHPPLALNALPFAWRAMTTWPWRWPAQAV